MGVGLVRVRVHCTTCTCNNVGVISAKEGGISETAEGEGGSRVGEKEAAAQGKGQGVRGQEARTGKSRPRRSEKVKEKICIHIGQIFNFFPSRFRKRLAYFDK